MSEKPRLVWEGDFTDDTGERTKARIVEIPADPEWNEIEPSYVTEQLVKDALGKPAWREGCYEVWQAAFFALHTRFNVKASDENVKRWAKEKEVAERKKAKKPAKKRALKPPAP